eukprot:COSAG02_NODE_9369_length_2239_cov_3.166355_2_plen_157_part_00
MWNPSVRSTYCGGSSRCRSRRRCGGSSRCNDGCNGRGRSRKKGIAGGNRSGGRSETKTKSISPSRARTSGGRDSSRRRGRRRRRTCRQRPAVGAGQISPDAVAGGNSYRLMPGGVRGEIFTYRLSPSGHHHMHAVQARSSAHEASCLGYYYDSIRI